MITRKLLIRKQVVNSKVWLNFIVVCIAVAISASYEFIDWGCFYATGKGGDSCLGSQGYV
jgi:putative membrane protein